MRECISVFNGLESEPRGVCLTGVPDGGIRGGEIGSLFALQCFDIL